MAIYSKNYKDKWNLRDQVTYSSDKTYLKQYSYFFGIAILYS